MPCLGLFILENDWYPLYRRLGGLQGVSGWMVAENLALARIRSLDCAACSMLSIQMISSAGFKISLEGRKMANKTVLQVSLNVCHIQLYFMSSTYRNQGQRAGLRPRCIGTTSVRTEILI